MTPDVVQIVVQAGAVGLLLVVLYFGGKIAKSFVERALDQFEQLVRHSEQNAKDTAATARSVEELRRENTTAHEHFAEALRRLGGYRPSPGEFPAVRPKMGSKPGGE